MNRTAAITLCGIALVAMIGFAVGRRAGTVPPGLSREGEAAALRQKLELTETKLKEQSILLGELADRRVSESARAAGFEKKEIEPESGEGFSIDRELSNVQELVAALEGMDGREDLNRRDVMDFVHEKLLRELMSIPAALSWALEKYLLEPETYVGEMIAVVLGQIRHPAVEKAALDLARSGTSLSRQLAGLDLLDRLDIENPATRRTVLDLLRSDRRPEIISGALYALHHGVPNPSEIPIVMGILTQLTSNADAEVRRRTVIAIAEWAPDTASLEPVVLALRDPSVDVRVGAAFALSRSRVVSEDIRDALSSRVSDRREDTAVREQAWQALGQFRLDPRSYAVYEEFRRLREASGEDAGREGE